MSNLDENDPYKPEPENFWKESGMTLLVWLFMVGVIAAIIWGVCVIK